MSTTSSFSGPVERKIKSADGTWIYASATGDPSLPSIVFIPGFGCTIDVYDQLFTDSRLLAKFYLVRYDIRGLGWSDHPEEAAAYESIRFAEDFAAVADTYNLKKPFLAGWSYGGVIGADVITHLGADYLSGIILLAGHPTLADGMTFRIAAPYIVGLLPGILSQDDVPLALKTRIEFGCSLSSSLPPGNLLSSWIGASSHLSPTAANLLLTRTQDSTALFAAGRAGTVPHLIVQGTKDLHLVPNQIEAEIKTFRDLTVKTVEGAGHAIFYDAQDETVDAILTFVAKSNK